jgi:hypothetical protein
MQRRRSLPHLDTNGFAEENNARSIVRISSLVYFHDMPTRLPYREELFAHEVAAFTPPDRAYLLAGYKSRPEFARANACRLLRKPVVVQRIDELRADFRERCALSVEYLQALLLPIVESNVLDCFESASKRPGRLRFKPLDELSREQGLAIAGLKLGENGAVVDLKFHSKTEAARTLMATLGIKEGDENAGMALAELGKRLGAALARTNEKVIEHSNAPAPLPAADSDDRVVEIIEC